MATQGAFYDYILTRNERADYDLIGPAGGAEKVGSDGAYRLYRVIHS